MRPQVMGVLNVTPDSFSDGGRWFDHRAAVRHGLDLFAAGADVVDVGGESTRPGAVPVDADEETRRVVPVVEALAGHGRVSVDTSKPAVARAAVAAGATLINDVSAELGELAATLGVAWIAMHKQGDPATMQRGPHYDDVVAEVCAYLVAKADAARAGGVPEVWIDPGIGFGKTAAHNLLLLRHLRGLVATGYPVLVGVSRKSFLGRAAVPTGDLPLPVDDREEASLAAATYAMVQGAAMVRVHDVVPAAQAALLVGERPQWARASAVAGPSPVGAGTAARAAETAR